MNEIEIIKKKINDNWYIQSFSGTPAFLNPAALSGFTMKKELGLDYSYFIFIFKKGLGEMWYLDSDLKRIWKIAKKRMEKNPRYLKEVKRRYEKIFENHERSFKKVNSPDLSKAKEGGLLALMKKCAKAVTDGVGIAHILEGVGLEIEKEFEKEISKIISDKKEFNRLQVILTTPKKLSFIAREEKDLRKIAMISGEKQKKALSHHCHEYSWIQNSYIGQKELNLSYFRERLNELKKLKPEESAKNQSVKYKLSREARKIAEVIKYTTVWQDERKEKILRAIGYLDRIFKEIGKRTGMPTGLLHYLGATDILKIRSLGEIRSMKKEFIRRKKGVFILLDKKRELFIAGNGYEKLIKYKGELSKKKGEESREIRGSIANGGKAIGRAIICRSVHSIDKFRKGDILVTSMTRPEFLPILKKAAAIVADEGGITSHAAIVARELNIPAVIGTKIATKVLKDGDIVEVRANHGIVKIIK